MPDLDQIKQGEQGVRDRRGRFATGRAIPPAGRAAAGTTSTARCPGVSLGETPTLFREFVVRTPDRWQCRGSATNWTEEVPMADRLSPKPPKAAAGPIRSFNL